MKKNSLKKLLAKAFVCLSFCFISCHTVESVHPSPDYFSGDTYQTETASTYSEQITNCVETEKITSDPETNGTNPVITPCPDITETEYESTNNIVSSVSSVETTENSESESDTINDSDLIYTSAGLFELTAYCPCEKCCGQWALSRPLDENGEPIVLTSSGERAKEGITIAADTSIYPFGTKFKIGENIYTVQDRGSAINGNRIDIYFESHEAALKFGRQKDIEVFLVTES